MEKPQGIGLALVAFGLYLAGGLSTFFGFGLYLLMDGKDLLGLGDGRGLGYLFICVGFCVCIIGVLCMRIFRNRGLM